VGFKIKNEYEGCIRTLEGNRGSFPSKVNVFSYHDGIPRLLGYVRFFG